jgi:two-component system NtrC family sensor kinase
MLHFAHVSWLGILAAAVSVPIGQGAAAIGLLLVSLVIYLGFREHYLVVWLGGWGFFLLSRQPVSASWVGEGSHVLLAVTNVAFVLAVTLFSVSAMLFTDSRRELRWIGALFLLGVGAAINQAMWFPSSPAALLCFQFIYHAIGIWAAVHLLLFARGRREVGPWFFALTLLLLHMDKGGGGRLSAAYDFVSAGSLRMSILFMVLDESRARARRLGVVNTIATVAVGARDYSGMMLTAMNELCRLYGAKFAWFQLVEGEDLVIKAQVGLPEWLTATRLRVSIRNSSVAKLLGLNPKTTKVAVRSLAPELRDDLERIGMRYLILVPVAGETELIGILAFGLAGQRSFTADQLRFLTTTANQLGIAGENLRMFEQVVHSRRQWLCTIDSIDDYILVHDAEPRVLRLNRALARRLGRTLMALTGEPLASVLPNAEHGCPYCQLAKQTDGEVADPCFGGYSLISTSSYVEDQGGVVGTVHIICDRTERRAGEERYRVLFESVQEGVFVSTPEGRLIDCNPAFISMLGYADRAEMLGVDIGKEIFLSAASRAAHSEKMEEQGYLRNYEVALRRKDGRVVAFMENSFATRDTQGKIERYQGFLVDITEKKRAEEDMQRRNRELGALNAMASLATRTFDLDEILQNTLYWITEIYGQYSEILLFDTDSGRVMRSETSRENREEEREELRRLVEEELAEYFAQMQSELITEKDLPRLPTPAQEWIKKHGCESFVVVLMYSQRKTLGMLLISSPGKGQFNEIDRNLAMAIARQLGNSVEKVLLYEDTARAYDNLRNTQEQLLQSEKMSALGQLISGVAHELNNPLTAILGYAQLLETEPIGERALDYVRKLYRQTQRTHRVVQNLLSFSRQRKPLQSKVDLRRVLEDTLALREFDLKLNNVIVERSYDPAAPFIIGDAHQLEQVFLNIINNAVDAIMDSGRGGTLKVRIYPEGDRVCIEFRDSGPGLRDPKKIFDPFYTTKKIGKGTGLGLSICYGIIKEHGGDIIAFNHEDGGALFQLKLPIAGPQKLQADTHEVKSSKDKLYF